MGINKRQFAQLNEMGIEMFTFRHKVTSPVASASTKENVRSVISADNSSTVASFLKTSNTLEIISIESLKSSLLFHNIIDVMGVSIGEVTQENDHYNLGLFNWYFDNAKGITENKHDSDKVIVYQDNNLVTPTIDQISASASLKKQLWLTLSQHII